MYERIVVPTVLYGAKTWDLDVREKRRLNVMEMKCLWTIRGVKIRIRIRNEEIKRRVGLLRLFGHVEHMDVERMVKRIYNSGVGWVAWQMETRQGLDGWSESSFG